MHIAPSHVRRIRAAALVAALAAMATVDHPAHADEPVTASVEVVRVQREPISQPVRAYGVVATSSASLTTVILPYVARIRKVRVLPGQSVARGAPLVVVQADPAAALAASQAATALTLARGELARVQALYQDGLATQSQLAAAQKALDDAQQGQAAQQRMGVRSGDVTIAAPIAGVVMQISALPGDQLQAGAAIAQVAARGGAGREANVTLGVEPSAVASIRAGDTLVLHGLSTALAHANPAGHVVVVGASVDPQSQLVNIGANVPLGGTPFIPGTRVSADIATQTGTWWVVPRSAVLRDEAGAYVFQIGPTHRAHRVNVAVRVENGGRYGVDGSLNPAQPVVAIGNDELQDGMRIRLTGASRR